MRVYAVLVCTCTTLFIFNGCKNTATFDQSISFQGSVYTGHKDQGTGEIIVDGPAASAAISCEGYCENTATDPSGSYSLTIKTTRKFLGNAADTFTLNAFVPGGGNEKISVNGKPGDTIRVRSFLISAHGEEQWRAALKRLIFFLIVSSVVLARLPFLQCEEMVEISFEITEINTNKANALGIKWPDTIQLGEVAWRASGRIPEALPEVPSIIDVGDWARYTALTAELKALQESGAAQVLSKPKLVTRSGTTAKFLVGGQFPVVAIGPTTASVEWKEFGIKTEILPRILTDRYIDLTLTSEVSRLDWSKTVQGYPVISTRQASSSVRLKSEQTVTLAGMIETTKSEETIGIPLLSDIPVLGYLFSRKNTIENKTNVLIFVTPRIIEQ